MPRISELPPVLEVTDTDQLETNQGGASRRVAFSQVRTKLGTIYAPIDSPVFTGEPNAVTPPTDNNSTRLATTAFVKNQNYAPLASPVLTGNPTAPTPLLADNDTSIATTAFVARAISAIPPPAALDPDVISWWTSVNTNGGMASTTQIQAVNTLISSLRTAGAYNLMDDIWLLANYDSNGVQAMISLKQRRLGTLTGTATFTKRGVRFGASSYIRSGFIPGTHAVAMTGSNMQIGVYLAEGTSGSTTSFGVYQAVNQSCFIWPKSGGAQFFYGLNCPAANGGAYPDSTGLTSAYRNGTTFGSRVRGADGTLYVPATNATVLPTLECYIGARNNIGVADQFYLGTIGLVFAGADLTLAREPAVYAAIQAYMLAVGALDVYCNSSTGLDTAIGDINNPYLTYNKAFVGTQAGGTCWLYGTTASPLVYSATGSGAYNVTKAVTVRAINPRGAKVSGSGGSTILFMLPVNGETINFIDLIFDASLNSGGPALACLNYSSQAIAYRVNHINCLFTGWSHATSGYGNWTSAANFRGYLTYTGCDFVANGDAAACIGAQTIVQGSVQVTNCTFTMASNTANFGPVMIKATATGVEPCNIVGCTVNQTIKSGLPDGTNYTLWIVGVANSRIADCVVNVYNTTVVRGIYGPTITSDGAAGVPSATEYDASGGIIENNTVYFEPAGGGAAICMGAEGYGDNTKRSRMIMRNNTVIVTPSSASGGTHALFFSHVTDGQMYGNRVTGGGINIVNKNSVNTQMHDNTITGNTSNGILHKGSTGGRCYSNTITFTPTGLFAGGVTLSQDPATGGSGVFTSGVVMSGNVFVNNGGTSINFVNVFAGCSGTFEYNTYQHSLGTLYATGPFFYQTVRYATFAAWKAAIEPTAVANFP